VRLPGDAPARGAERYQAMALMHSEVAFYKIVIDSQAPVKLTITVCTMVPSRCDVLIDND